MGKRNFKKHLGARWLANIMPETDYALRKANKDEINALVKKLDSRKLKQNNKT